MKHQLSRKQFLSLGFYSGLGWVTGACTLDDVPPAGMGGGTGDTTATTGAAGNATTTGNPTAGTSGSTTIGSGGSGGSAAGSGGGGAGGGGGGGKGGSGGSAGAGGKGGASGSAGAGGRGGAGGSPDAGAKDGSGGAGGSKDGGAGGDGGMCTGMIVANISGNHTGTPAGNGPHGLVIPPADIALGMAKVYMTTSVMGMTTQNHMHFVQVTAADFAMLKAGMTVKKHSCSGGDHEYVLKCGGTTDMGAAPVGCVDECGGMMTNPCN